MPATLDQLLTGVLECTRVAVRGVVQRVNLSDGLYSRSLTLSTPCGGHFLVVPRLHAGFTPERFVDAEVEVRGVNVALWNPRGEQIGARVLPTDLEDVTILHPPPEDAFSVPLLTLAQLRQFTVEPPSRHRQARPRDREAEPER